MLLGVRTGGAAAAGRLAAPTFARVHAHVPIVLIVWFGFPSSNCVTVVRVVASHLERCASAEGQCGLDLGWTDENLKRLELPS